TPDSPKVAPGISSSTQAVSVQSPAQPVGTSTTGSTAPALSNLQLIVSEIKRHKIRSGLIAAIVLVAVSAGVSFIYKLPTSNKQNGPSAITFTRLTAGGRIGNELILGGADISPDGKYVVFRTGDDQGRSSLYVRQVSTNSVVRVAGPVETAGG